MKLTEALLSHDSTKEAYRKATQSEFLLRAGRLELSREELQAWLTQDRLYALCGYAPFLGLLISRCPTAVAGPNDSSSQTQRKRLTVLASAMANIDREVGFFEDVAEENRLDLNTASKDDGLGLLNSITRGYIDYMIAVSSRGTFEEALVLLWAMEKLYLDAWTFASSHLPHDKEENIEAGAVKALISLIPNWSAKEFQQFVDNIAELVNELGVDLQSDLGGRVLEVWQTTIWYEERFWLAGKI